MKPRTLKWIYVAATIIILGYMVGAAFYTNHARGEQLCKGIYVQVIDSAQQNFVTPEELRQELGRLPEIARRTPAVLINTDSLERALSVIDKIESVSVKRLTDGSISIIVEPMRPVLRVFDTDRSYYINRAGKRMSAEARYHVDVPVVQGNFSKHDTTLTPLKLLPLIDFIAASPRWSKIVSMIKADSPNDIIIVPAVRGLVFNIGNLNNFPDKFARLERMMQQVLPEVGWDFYDTISVKWKGQAVATHRIKERPDTLSAVEEVHEKDDIETMTVGDGVAAGQAKAGQKAVNSPSVPGADKLDKPKDKPKEKTKEASKESANNTSKNKTEQKSDTKKSKSEKTTR